MTTVFFGHRDASESVLPALKDLLAELTEKEKADRFLVGNEGAFDRLVQKALREFSQTNPDVRYAVVLAYLPKTPDIPANTLYPEGLETVPQRFAISKRNLWMLEQADTAVFYVTAPIGNAYKLMLKAKAKGKNVINLSDLI